MPGRTMRVAALGLAAVVTIGAASGCEKVNSVASSVSPCFRVLPIAREAVGNRGDRRPVDIARVRGGAVPRIGPFRPRPTTTLPGAATRPPRDFCLIAYRGPYTAADISSPRLVGSSRAGLYAVVAVAVRTQRVSSVLLTDRLPSPLRRH